jgi:hypothetical protein
VTVRSTRTPGAVSPKSTEAGSAEISGLTARVPSPERELRRRVGQRRGRARRQQPHGAQDGLRPWPGE